jgi:hypothetical protein
VNSGPVLGISTLVATNNPEKAQFYANIESAFTAGSGLFNAKEPAEMAASILDTGLSIFGAAYSGGCGN